MFFCFLLFVVVAVVCNKKSGSTHLFSDSAAPGPHGFHPPDPLFSAG